MVGVGCLYPGRETCLGLGGSTQVGRHGGGWWLYPGRETWWGLGGCTQVGRHAGSWMAVSR